MSPSQDKLRRLGSSDLWVSPVGFGCWPIAGMTSLNVNDSDSKATIEAAISAGINFMDTAYCYGANGESDRLLAQVIQPYREYLVIATKGGVHWDPTGAKIQDASPGRLKQECEESLQRLNIDVIDLLYLHAPDPNVPVEQSATAYVELLHEGKIRAVGASNCNVDQLKRFQAVCPIQAVQPPYNMLQRQIESDVIPWCMENEAAVVNYWPLMKGLLAGKIRRGHKFEANDKRTTYDIFQGEQFERAQRLLDLLDKIAEANNKTVSQVVVNWTFNRPGIASTLCGAKRDWQISETAGAMGWQLSAEDLSSIETLLNDIETGENTK